MTRTWHIVTCEYPPQLGGVSDHTHAIATALGCDGPVHVWAPGRVGDASSVHGEFSGMAGNAQGVTVHRELGSFSPADCRRAGALMNRFAARRLLVQWVPHGFGYKSLNVPFALWLASRVWLRGDELHLLVHEPYMRESWPPRYVVASAIEQLMLWIVGTAASRVWLSTPSWHDYVAPYVRRETPIEWLPIPAPQEVGAEGDVARRFSGASEVPGSAHSSDSLLVGHFSTHSPVVTRILEPAIEQVLHRSTATVLLIGRDSEKCRERIVNAAPQYAERIQATGAIDMDAVVSLIRECDVMLQPFPDGITVRNTSALLSLACRVPLVTNHGPLTEQVWACSRAAILAGAPDAAQLAARTLDALDDASMRQAVAAAGARLYYEQFDIHRAVSLLKASTTVSDRLPSTVSHARA